MNTVFVHKLPAAAAPWAWAIEFDYNADFIAALKSQIPSRARRYVPERKVWVFRAEVIDMVCTLATIHVGRVVHVESVDNDVPVDAYAALHLLPSAPPQVVTAAYKALAKLAHPDKGGNKAQMQRVNSAYEAIQRDYA